MSKKSDNSGLCAILAWIFPIGLIWFFVDDKIRKNKFVEFHVKQSLVLVGVSFLFQIASVVLNMITFGILGFVGVLVQICCFILWIIGIIYAAQGKKKELPIIGQFAKKIKF